MIGVRDPLGIRPLVLGKLDGCYILASETCALDIIGADFIREVENGEVVVITKDEVKSYHPFPEKPRRHCIFEYIYFARPDSVVDGHSVYECRKSCGRQLASESNVQADMVIPVPDSGVPAAIGYAEESQIPFELGITRNHYVGRTFIEPKQSIRSFSVKLKHNANSGTLKGKKVVLVDKEQNLGGVCLNRGCIPSKALIHASERMHHLEQHMDGHMGMKIDGSVSLNMGELVSWKDEIVTKLNKGVEHLLKNAGAKLISGWATFKDAKKETTNQLKTK